MSYIYLLNCVNVVFVVFIVHYTYCSNF